MRSLSTTTRPTALLALLLLVAGCAGAAKSRVPAEHTTKILSATATAEEDLVAAKQLMREERYLDAFRTVLNRLKSLDNQIYDEYKLKSAAYLEGDLPTVRGYAVLIGELEKAEDALLQYLNEPLTVVLEKILLNNPDPRAKDEALDVIAGSANEVFTQFQEGYRQDLLDNLEVRAKGETDVALSTKMLKIIETLNAI